MLALGPLILLVFLPVAGGAQTPGDAFARGRAFYEIGDYAGAEKMFRQALAFGPATAELYHLLGLCAAFQGRLDEAEQCLLAAIRTDPSFADSHVEIGGLYFKQKRYAGSERALRRALKLDPGNGYARDLLGTVYFINGSQELALEEWNRIGRPVLDEQVIAGDGIARPELLRRELRTRPGQLVRPSGIRESLIRLDKVDCFSAVSFSLRPSPDRPEKADLLISGREEQGFGPGPAAVVVRGLRDALHRTAYLDFKNIGHRGVNLHAAYRWDPNQRMGELAAQVPRLLGTPFYYRLSFRDLRERWLFEAPEVPGENTEFAQSEREIRLDVDHVLNDRISLDHHVRIKRTSYLPVSGAAPEGSGTRFGWGGDYTFRLADRPAPALTAELGIHYDLSSRSAANGKPFVRSVLSCSVAKSWARGLPREASGRLTGRLTWGASSAGTPFDEYFVLGMGPGVEYQLRAYRATAAGKLGHGPVGKSFFLTSVDYIHRLGKLAFIPIDGGVFFDAGQVTGAPPFLQEANAPWLTDLGVSLAARVFRVSFRLSYAHSLAGSRQALHLSAALE